MKRELLIVPKTQWRGMLFAVLGCLAFLTGCGSGGPKQLPPAMITPAMAKQREARFDFKQGPVFVRMKDKHLFIVQYKAFSLANPLSETKPQKCLVSDIVSIRYERAFKTNRLVFRMKPGRELSDPQFDLDTSLDDIDGELTSLKQFLGKSAPNLKVDRNFGSESANGPLEFMGMCGLLLLICFVVGSLGAALGAAATTIALVIGWLYARQDSEMVSYALAQTVHTQAAAIIHIGIPVLMALLVTVWMLTQRHQELNPEPPAVPKVKKDNR